MNRILSQHGNVIAADFGRRSTADLTVTIKTDTLYLDDRVLLTRTTALLDDRPLMVLHIVADLTTGQLATL